MGRNGCSQNLLPVAATSPIAATAVVAGTPAAGALTAAATWSAESTTAAARRRIEIAAATAGTIPILWLRILLTERRPAAVLRRWSATAKPGLAPGLLA